MRDGSGEVVRKSNSKKEKCEGSTNEAGNGWSATEAEKHRKRAKARQRLESSGEDTQNAVKE